MSSDVIHGLRWLAGMSLVVPVFYFTPQGDAYRWVDLSGVSVSVIIAAAALAFTATMQPDHSRALALSASAVCWIGAAVQFYAVLRVTPGVMGGNASTWALLSALGLGYACLALADRIPASRLPMVADHPQPL